jgi:transcriptional regulator with XRE-family HTH domain
MSDDFAIGRMVRDVRRSRGQSQESVAARAGVSRETVSRLERGLGSGMTVERLRAVSLALGMPSIVTLGWRGPELERLRDRRHAALVEQMSRILLESGWEVVPEYTFNHYGERGAVDGLAWHSVHRALFIGEIKTRIWDLQEMLSTLDRKRRLIPGLLRLERGWDARSVGLVLTMNESSTHRHLIERHAATFRGALPGRQIDVRRWLDAPTGDLRGIWFLPDSHRMDRGKAPPRSRTVGRARKELRVAAEGPR